MPIGFGAEGRKDWGLEMVLSVVGVFDADAVVSGEAFEQGGEGGAGDAVALVE